MGYGQRLVAIWHRRNAPATPEAMGRSHVAAVAVTFPKRVSVVADETDERSLPKERRSARVGIENTHRRSELHGRLDEIKEPLWVQPPLSKKREPAQALHVFSTPGTKFYGRGERKRLVIDEFKCLASPSNTQCVTTLKQPSLRATLSRGSLRRAPNSTKPTDLRFPFSVA